MPDIAKKRNISPSNVSPKITILPRKIIIRRESLSNIFRALRRITESIIQCLYKFRIRKITPWNTPFVKCFWNHKNPRVLPEKNY